MLILVFFAKIVVFLIFTQSNMQLTGGGKDSDYYDEYARGVVDYAVNIWPVFLRILNEMGLYNRQFVSLFLCVVVFFVLPPLVCQIIKKESCFFRGRDAVVVFLIFWMYPTLNFYSLDVYRDVVLVLVALFSWSCVQNILSRKSIVLQFFVFSGLCYVSFLLRPYLGFSLFFSFVLYFLAPSIIRFKWFYFFIYWVVLMILYWFGVLDPLIIYRGQDGFDVGGTSFGIGLAGLNPFDFVKRYVVSAMFQVFGGWLYGVEAVVVFIVESLPFVFALFYVFRNIRYLSAFGQYLVMFFVVYTTIWVIGNDNLGTAVRLRMISYISMLVCFYIVWLSKKKEKYYSVLGAQRERVTRMYTRPRREISGIS
jgi:hypothetical protein